jgi:hypothetical protein
VIAALLLLLPVTSVDRENAVLTLALALPGIAAVAADRLLRRPPRRRTRGGR